MSTGQKAWAEELEAQAFNDAKQVFLAHNTDYVVSSIESVIDALQRMSNCSELSLTKSNWVRLDHCISSLKSLVK